MESDSFLFSCACDSRLNKSYSFKNRFASESTHPYLTRPFLFFIFFAPLLVSPVGSGKTALMLELCRRLSKDYSLACVTNDIFTTEDTDFLVRNKALEDPERIVAIETGGCPHAAIREDISANLAALEQLQAKFNPELLLIESGGDNLAANYSRELADYIIYGTSFNY